MKTLSTLCRECGRCCQSLVLPVAKPLQKAIMESWLDARGCEVVGENEDTFYVSVNSPCPHLVSSGRKSGLSKSGSFACDIYENRPEGCRIFDGSKYDFLNCAWKSIPKNYITLEKAGIECPFCKKAGIRLRRYKQDHLWITEYRCPNGHIFQKES